MFNAEDRGVLFCSPIRSQAEGVDQDFPIDGDIPKA